MFRSVQLGRRRAGGFTIVELLVAVAVVAILAAVAAPIYTQYLVRGQRSAARAGLLQAAQAMERYYTANGSYLNAGAIPLAAVGGTTGCIGLVPANSTNSVGVTYCISGAAVTATNGFLLSATPCGASGASCGTGANTSFNDPECGTLTLDNTGTRGSSVAGAATRCWSS